MECDIVKHEKEFLAQDERIRMETDELMKKFEDIMKNQNLLPEYSPIHNNQKNKKTPNFNGENKNKKDMNYYLKTKIQNMQLDYDKLQNDLKKKDEEMKLISKEKQKIGEDKEKWFLQYNCAQNTVTKLENQIKNLKSRLESNENQSLKRELESLKKDLKTANANLNSCEIRLNRSVEDNEKLKETLKAHQQNDKDLKDVHKRQIKELSANLRKSEQQKNEILHAFKKQIQLINNLKNQLVYLKSLKLTEIAEMEYEKILDWKPR